MEPAGLPDAPRPLSCQQLFAQSREAATGLRLY